MVALNFKGEPYIDSVSGCQFMPELPEVETTVRGIRPYLAGRCLRHIRVRDHRLRWPVPESIGAYAAGQKVLDVGRRGKYIIVRLQQGGLLVHLGMSGSMRIVGHQEPPGRHAHFDLVTEDVSIRYTDPRRFGCLLIADQGIENHPLLVNLGVEPLTGDFSGHYLHRHARRRRVPIKTLLMDARVVVGVGNIYASEALFLSQIRPRRGCFRVSLVECENLAAAVKNVLSSAIRSGGTTLRDFSSAGGQPGYFEQQLYVYGRAGGTCRCCGAMIKSVAISRRSSFYCPRCQR